MGRNQVCYNVGENKCGIQISHLTQDGKEINDPQQMANIFNNFFVNVSKKITNAIPRTRKSPLDYLTLRAPRVLVPTPSTKGGGRKGPPPSISRTRNATNLKPVEGLGVSFKVSKNFKLV